VDYGTWGDGEHPASTYPYAAPQSPDDTRHPTGSTRGAEFRVPGQREHRDHDGLARPYVPTGESGWRPSGGRHRQPPAADAGARQRPPARPDPWRSQDRWRPTLDPTDWRYTTGELGYRYDYRPWKQDRPREVGVHDGHDGLGFGWAGRTERGAADWTGNAAADWTGNADTDQWQQTEDWRRDDAAGGQDASRRRSLSDTGAWDRVSDTGEWPAGSRNEGFWSGIRLAGDDPRWMATPSTAPRSPAVSLPASIQHADPPGLPSVSATASTASEDREPSDDRRATVWAALLATVAWYVVPALVLVAWILTLDGSPTSDCTAAALGCESAQARATDTVMDSGPRLATALGASAVIAVLLRLASSWRAAGIGLAAAVLGGGLSTLIISLLTGQPLG
jgi:hypothetical protein